MLVSRVSPSRHINVSRSSISAPVSTNVSAPGTGMVRFNVLSQFIEFYDGYTWQRIPTEDISFELNPTPSDALEWAIAKMNEEKRLEQLAQTNPTIKDLVDQKKSIDEKIKMVEVLTRGNFTIETS